MEYKFDGYDAILNERDELIYDGLDSRAADIIIRQMEGLELCDAEIAKLQTELKQQKACYRVVAKNLMTYGTITEKLRSRIAELTADHLNVSILLHGEGIESADADKQAPRVAALISRYKASIKELEAAKAEIATLAQLALDATNIFSYAEPLAAAQSQYETANIADHA